MTYIDNLGKNAKASSQTLLGLGSSEKNNILRQVAQALIIQTDYILAENDRDLKAAKENGISDIMLDRLRLTE